VLHPGMLDSAVQASIGLLQNRDGIGETLLPFALELLNVYGRCQPQMWALISIDGRNAGSAVQRIDIDVCDEHGQIAVALRGFSSRPVRAGRERPADQSLPAGLSLLAPQWVIADSPSMPPQALPTLAIGASNERRD